MNPFQEKPQGLLDHLFQNVVKKVEPKPTPKPEPKQEKNETAFIPPDFIGKNKGLFQLFVLVSENINTNTKKMERVGSIGECKRRYMNAKQENPALKFKFFDCSDLNTSKLFHKWEDFLASNFPNQF